MNGWNPCEAGWNNVEEGRNCAKKTLHIKESRVEWQRRTTRAKKPGSVSVEAIGSGIEHIEFSASQSGASCKGKKVHR